MVANSARGLDCQYDRAQHLSTDQHSTFSEHPQVLESYTRSDRHIQELSLMHRWTTTTYDTIPTKYADDNSIWETEMPEVALQHPFLLNALLSITTFELSGPPETAAADYVKAAMDYRDLAVHDLPDLSSTTTAETNAALVYLEPLILLMILVSVQHQPSTTSLFDILQLLTRYLTLMQSIHSHLNTSSATLAHHPLHQATVTQTDIPSQMLDVLTSTTFRNLDDMNKSRPEPPDEAPFKVRFTATLHQASCKKALFWLEEAFTHLPCHSQDTHDFNGRRFLEHCLGWVQLIDGEYIAALREGDQVAILLFLTWTVLVQTHGHRFWWARNLATKLFQAISGTIDEGTAPVLHEIFSWARRQLHQVQQAHVEPHANFPMPAQ
ncbi:uncharacterized protein HMPREF1541_00367 [Cyphellophora europaea CBS 101466]|uniref:Transcription factor domain-containing protein n=1 Tax=Cyphellophora europaea (strain CBS 101466) TaxID=1220924 RepID=W2SDR7_CYPE1|nr:uncharacterized protein HMPREF1541_00367 [Cyphellophora europaea CBS 101466]ETN46183.1 hypothetical protein HMPREF1541_00367 [Cyphellophora europaea CBS 101466]